MKTRKPSQDDILRLGTQVATIKSQADPSAWKALVKRAHKGGYTVAGELSGQPAALKERTQASLKTQAQKTIATSYAPAEASITADQAKVEAWNVKRKADNASYETWLAAQREKQGTILTGAMSELRAQNDRIMGDTQAAWSAAGPGAQQAVAAQPGTVSDMSQSKALDFGAAAARGNETIKNSAGLSNQIMQGVNQSQQDAVGVGLAQAGAREAQRYADTSKMQSDLFDSKTKLAVSKAGDYLKEFTRLTDAETTKASSNRDSAILADKLQVGQDTLALKGRALDHTIAKDSRTAAQKSEDLAIKKGKLLLDQGKADLNSDGLIDQKDYKLKVKIDAKSKADAKGPKTASEGEKTRSIDKTGAVSRVYALLVDMHKKYDPKYGGKPTPGHDTTTFRHLLTGSLKGGASSIMIDLAEDARTHGGRLSAAGRKKARLAGILNPEQIQL